MDLDLHKQRIAALLRAFQLKKLLNNDNIPCKIEEGLYLGSLGAANNRSGLKSLNVTHILTVAHSLAPAYPNDFVYKIIGVPDTANTTISRFFDECFTFIEEARTSGGGVLVHCFAGRSRSVTVIVAYLIYKRAMSLSEALEYVKTKRPSACPNPGFMLQLQAYEKSLRDVRTENGGADEPEKNCNSQ